MANQNDIDRVWDILERHSIGMLTTQFGAGMRARPLDARPDRDAGTINFITDVRGHKDDEIASEPDVCFIVVEESEKVYLSITGRASVARDDAKAERYWKQADEVWWKDGPRDANVRVLTIAPVMAELWDGPSSSLVAAYEFAKARMTGEKPMLGENRKKTVEMG